jgi:class 3 adenylate cyclase/tetratricopeptide (TPR) repeat protein
MKCPRCQAENRAGAKFCEDCGASLAAPCRACGAELTPGKKFCGSCGAPTSSEKPAERSEKPAERSEKPAERLGEVADRFASPQSYTPKHLAEKILTSKAAIEGERKIVTVMFSDVSGFTAMSEKLDPEDVHGIMDRVFEVILDAVHRHEGTINQFLGDGVMALFGAPIAHEDHAQRALSAALEIQEGLKPVAEDVKRTHGIEFHMRMGINTGPVVVGAIGRDLRMDYTAVGDTTNLAARLLGIAKPGQIVVSRGTQHMRDRSFTFEDLGDFQVKGKTEPVRAYAVAGERRRTRLEVSKERGLSPLIGRVRELELLNDAWKRASGGQGAIALLSGEAGVGKSRLLYEFLGRLDAAGAVELETTCVSYGRSMAYRPIVEVLRRYLGLSDGVGGEELRRRVADQLQLLDMEGEEPVILLAHFLGVSAPPEFLDRLAGPQLKKRTLDVLRDVFLHASETAPLIFVVENLHWVDTASEEFLAHLAAGLPGHRLLVGLTSRPGYEAPWLAPPLAESIALEGLEAGDVRGMVRTLLGVQEVAEQLFKILDEKSEGNPLYVEEILRQLVETGGIVGEHGEARLSRPDVTVPATIHDIIAARIDRIADPLKQTLQGAAVVGRRFGISLVSRILQVAPDQVAGHMRDLHALDFVFPSAQEPELMYSFKHALTQDVVYGGVLERRRRTYHAAAGHGLEELYAGRIDDAVELIAYHFGRGQVWEKAATYFRQAGAKAQRRSAHREAMASLEEALDALRHQPETPAKLEQEIDLHLALRGSLYPLGEFPTMLAHLREAETLATRLGDSHRLAWVSLHTGEYFRQDGRFVEARQLAEQALALGNNLQDLPLQLIASEYLALACYGLGDYRRAVELLREVARSRPDELRPDAFESTAVGSWSGHQVMTLAWLTRCLAECGEFEEGLAAGRQAVAIAEGLDSQYGLAAACIGLGYISLVKGDLDTAGPVLERACKVARNANLTLLRPQATRLLGGVYLLAGRIDEGVALVRAAADEVESRKLLMQHAAVLELLGEACLAADRFDEASAAAHRALSVARERSQRGDEAAALWLLGEIAARTAGETETAVGHYQAVIALTGELGKRPLLARTHLGLGRLWLAVGERARAEDELLAATRLFCEMDMGLWVRQTAATLSQLGRLLIVAADSRDLYEYLHRTLGDQWISVVLDRTGQVSAATEGDDRRDQERIDAMLRSRGLTIA